jgi:uncharacterized RDD family membrane protein YckC
VDGNGLCAVCGQRSTAPAETPPAEKAAEQAVASVESETAINGADSGRPEVPEWRQELSRRLQEIKSRREAVMVTPESVEPETPMPAPEVPESAPVRPAAARRPRRVASFPERERVRPAASDPDEPTPIPAETGREIQNHTESEVLLLPAAEVPVRPAKVVEDDHQDIKKLIDAAMTRYQPIEVVALPSEPESKANPPVNPNPEPGPERAPQPKPDPKPESKPETVPEPPRKLEFNPPIRMRPERKPEFVPEPDFEPMWMPASKDTLGPAEDPAEDKLILLTRTLAGLVDLIIIVLCAGCIILAVDILEGIEIWDTLSQIHYAALFLATYFVYSLFFLGMANQTIGMMLTDLRMVGDSTARAGILQILGRCGAFLLGVAALGIGLIWGFFDHRARCLHDLLSGTRIIRISY